MNTSVVLPHASWAPAAPAAKEAAKKITEVESDDDHGYRRSHRRLRSSENDDRRTRYEEKAPVRYEPRPEGRRRRPHRDEESDEEDCESDLPLISCKADLQIVVHVHLTVRSVVVIVLAIRDVVAQWIHFGSQGTTMMLTWADQRPSSELTTETYSWHLARSYRGYTSIER